MTSHTHDRIGRCEPALRAPIWRRLVVSTIKNILAVAACSGALIPLHAQDSRDLWKSTAAQLEASHRWIAADVAIVSDVAKGSEVKHVAASMQLRGWDQGKPVYALVKSDPVDSKQSLNKDFSFLDKFASLSDALSKGVPPKRIDGQFLDGIAATVFEIRLDETIQSGAVKLWVDPGSGAPRQMVITVHVPLAIDATITTYFVSGPHGQALPGSVDFAIEILLPFKKSQLHMRQTNSGWIERPVAAIPK